MLDLDAINLPVLQGSAKQVSWATEIRETQILKLKELVSSTQASRDDNYLSDEYLELIKTHVNAAMDALGKADSAKIIIDTRKRTLAILAEKFADRDLEANSLPRYAPNWQNRNKK